MASRILQFFVTENEFLEIINGVISELNLYPIYHLRIENSTIQLLNIPLTLHEIHALKIKDIYLAEHKPDLKLLDPKAVRPGFFGWVEVVFPKEKDNVLYLADIGFKSELKESLLLYNKVMRRIKKYLQFGVWFCDTAYTRSRFIKAVGYTEGAKEYSQNEGELMQKGVLNARFLCSPLPRKFSFT